MKLNFKVVDYIYKFLNDCNKRFAYLWGSAGSAKSFTIAHHLLVEKFLKEKNIRIFCIRKTLPSVRISSYQLITDLLAQSGMIDHVYSNKTELMYGFNGNQMHFFGLDDVNKKKSAEANYIWLEEPTDLSFQDWVQLDLRMRRQNENGENMMYLSFNPISMRSFLYSLCETKFDESCSAKLHCKWQDNPFLQEAVRKRLEGLPSLDKTLGDIYSKGIWGMLKNIIYTNWLTAAKETR
jgi:phage terminase large subunit